MIALTSEGRIFVYKLNSHPNPKWKLSKHELPFAMVDFAAMSIGENLAIIVGGCSDWSKYPKSYVNSDKIWVLDALALGSDEENKEWLFESEIVSHTSMHTRFRMKQKQI